MLSTVTDKGRITLPKQIRDQLGIAAGSRLAFEVQPDKRLKVSVLSRGSAGLFGLPAQPNAAVQSQEQLDATVSAALQQRGTPRR